MYDCPKCGEPTAMLHEGYCRECCEQGQRELDAHNSEFDRWSSLSDRKRDAEIRRAVNLSS